MMAKGTYARIILTTKDLDSTVERLQASERRGRPGAAEQPHGIGDCALRDPAGSLLRIQELH